MYRNDEDLISEFHLKAGHSESSVKSYRAVFKGYCSFHDMALSELLKEAIMEQENRIPENRLKIYDRIVSYRNFLSKTHMPNTINNAVSKIKTFYHYNRVYLPFIPPLNTKNIPKNDIIAFEDIPTKDELRLALEFADDQLRLWILVMISSGSSRAEAKSMTNELFFRGTYEYHKKDTFPKALRRLAAMDDAVCTCRLTRQKTDKPYYTFLNPECVKEIARVKLKEKDFDLDAPLLKYNLNHVNYKFKLLNDYLGFGQAGGFARLRPHMLRKFNSTYLSQGSLDGNLLAMDSVDMLHGRGKSKTRESYYKDNPEFLKLEYIRAMNNISLYHRYDWKVINGKVRIVSKPL
ncbi:hypothetical protein [uncultured Methanobrevibacter sp.]|uniref:hypothetical protein n=1 Tax=uncultured Methanobrevibacter sp. TaxID=253161 RepID=UPI00258DFFB4|nr:hypothetical protein [uncultured Methanobrevibacter sp.]